MKTEKNLKSIKVRDGQKFVNKLVWEIVEPHKRRSFLKKKKNKGVKGMIGKLKNIDTSPRPNGLCGTRKEMAPFQRGNKVGMGKQRILPFLVNSEWQNKYLDIFKIKYSQYAVKTI